jgi:multiple sugar transport system ATP-binding protein
MATVSIENVFKSFGSTPIIRGVSLEINDGEFLALVGPSGCGKSTLLRMLAGLEEITDGLIKINDRVINQLAPKERDIAMVFQNYALYPHMTVRQNMEFSLMLAKLERSRIDEKVGKTAKILDIEALLERFPRQLSGGQRQRVAMGRAIVRDPQVFLFDEPLSNLDAKLRVAMRVELKELHQRLKTTSIFVTHDQIEAMTMADKIVVMRDGHFEQIGTPLDLYDHPVNQFVAGFIGSPAMNFLPGVISKGQVLLGGGGVVQLPSKAKVQENQAVIYGFRPENTVIASDGQGLKGQVVVVEQTGSETQVFFKMGAIQITSVFKERKNFTPGENFFWSVDPERSHVFCQQTTQSLMV